MTSTPTHIPQRVAGHVVAFNHAVTSGDFEPFVARFAIDAVMSFVGVPAGPYRGRDAILAGYRAAPPTDTMSVTSSRSDGSTDVARFRWSSGGGGTMTLRWRDELVEFLEVAFDPS